MEPLAASRQPTAGAAMPRQPPAPSQASAIVQRSSSLQIVPLGSGVQLGEQQSPVVVLPSSQASPDVCTPLPHAVTVQPVSQPSPSTRLPSSHASPGST